jgi:hypothetical protein
MCALASVGLNHVNTGQTSCASESEERDLLLDLKFFFFKVVLEGWEYGSLFLNWTFSGCFRSDSFAASVGVLFVGLAFLG